MKRIICNSLQGLKPVVLMVVCQIAFAAVNIMYKLVINDGMSMRVATAYRLSFAAAFTVPLAVYFDRSILLLFFLLFVNLIFIFYHSFMVL